MCLKNGGKNSVGTFRKKELFIMKQRKIMLKTIEDAKKFVNASMKCDFDIDVFYAAVTLFASIVSRNASYSASSPMYSTVRICVRSRLITPRIDLASM